jgi:hypothetical protein
LKSGFDAINAAGNESAPALAISWRHVAPPAAVLAGAARASRDASRDDSVAAVLVLGERLDPRRHRVRLLPAGSKWA